MRQKIAQILADTLGLPLAKITDNTTMENTEAWDSVAHLNLVMSLESAFGVTLDPEEFLEMSSIEGMETVLARKGVA